MSTATETKPAMPDSTKTIEPECSQHDCKRPARVAVRTLLVGHLARDGIYMKVWFDDRDCKDKQVSKYCREHGIQVMAELTKMLVPPDES